MTSSRFLLSCVALAVLFCGAQAFMPPVSDDGFFRGENIERWTAREIVFELRTLTELTEKGLGGRKRELFLSPPRFFFFFSLFS